MVTVVGQKKFRNFALFVEKDLGAFHGVRISLRSLKVFENVPMTLCGGPVYYYVYVLVGRILEMSPLYYIENLQTFP